MASWYDWFSQQQQQPQQYKSWADFTTPGYDNMQQKNFTQMGLGGQYKPAQTGMGAAIGNDNANLSGGWGDWFSADKMSGYGNILSGIGSVAGAVNGYNQLGLQEDMFDFNRDLTKRNLANQARLMNNHMRMQAENNYAFQGGADNPNNPVKTPDEYMNNHGVSETIKGNKNRNRNIA